MREKERNMGEKGSEKKDREEREREGQTDTHTDTHINNSSIGRQASN